MHNLWLLSFFSTKNTGAPQDEELGWINPFCNCSPRCFLSSFNSSTDILYGLLAIGPDPGTKSIRNSTSLSGGIPGNSSGNTPTNTARDRLTNDLTMTTVTTQDPINMGNSTSTTTT